eukprot:13309910-Ditylum_brightwellii.AAC.1
MALHSLMWPLLCMLTTMVYLQRKNSPMFVLSEALKMNTHGDVQCMFWIQDYRIEQMQYQSRIQELG